MKSYWDDTGRFQSLADKLGAMIPDEGAIIGENNAKLERFRRASNAYYDLLNNGGCNLGSEIKALFGISLPDDAEVIPKHTLGAVEFAMDDFITAAAAEQGIS